jgi:membrane protein YqaA with SNARE-associated domain
MGIEFVSAAFLAGGVAGYFLGRWVQRKRTAGKSAAEIAAEAHALAKTVIDEVKK